MMKWHVRTTGILLGTVLACLGMTYLFLTSPAGTILIRRIVETEVGRRFGTPMEIGGLRIDLLRGGVIRDLRIFPAARTKAGRPILSIRRTELRYDLLEWIRGRPSIAEIILTEPRLILRVAIQPTKRRTRAENRAVSMVLVMLKLKTSSLCSQMGMTLSAGSWIWSLGEPISPVGWVSPRNPAPMGPPAKPTRRRMTRKITRGLVRQPRISLVSLHCRINEMVNPDEGHH